MKAVFLLLVFAMNTLVGFACAVGLDMGFNSIHHHDEEAIEVHIHANGKKHIHHNKVQGHHHGNKTASKTDNCCNDKVVKISQEDKAIPQSYTILNPVFFSSFSASYYNIDIIYPSQVATSVKYFVRNYHPPIPDIRIAIRSFQI